MATDIAQLTQQLHAEIEQTPERYRGLLLRVVHSFREGVEDEDAEIDPVESFRQGWKEVQEGKARPIEGLWKRVGLE